MVLEPSSKIELVVDCVVWEALNLSALCGMPSICLSRGEATWCVVLGLRGGLLGLQSKSHIRNTKKNYVEYKCLLNSISMRHFGFWEVPKNKSVRARPIADNIILMLELR